MTIYDHLLEKLSLRTKKLTVVQMKLAITQNNRGRSYQEIGTEFKIAKSTIGWFFLRYKEVLAAFESKKKEIKSNDYAEMMSQIYSGRQTNQTPGNTDIDVETTGLMSNRFPWGPVLVVIITLLLLYFFVLRNSKN